MPGAEMAENRETSVEVAKRLYGGMPRMPGAKMAAPEIAEGLDGEC